MEKRNYQRELDVLINRLENKPKLLLHSCCAPCSSYVLEYLSKHFDITVLYYNPNIYPENEYFFRENEQERFINQVFSDDVKFIKEIYNPDEFYTAVKGFEGIKEGGERCFKCYLLRLEKTAQLAKENNFDFFTTTLSISPYKNAEKLNEIGEALSEEYGVKYLVSDFKKKNGYKRSTELSKEYNIYRQDYCGCIFSKAEREAEKT
ncbi:MAG TPA: epoxyqueuosine reductase QueH [Oscillospiraceae bacterium]|nr:epoxyqueuosine reductase QueH [Oscillospiraceae bacterium]